MNGKLGTASVVIYFVNHTDPRHHEGYITLAPYSDCPTPKGWSRHEADDLPSIRRLEDTMNEQAVRELHAEQLRDEMAFGTLRQQNRERLLARLTSSETSEFDKDFIREWLKLKDERKREKHQRTFEQRCIFLHQLHNDIPKDRDANEERVDLDRLNVRS